MKRARARRWFGLDHDLERYAEFVWTARQVTTALTIAPDGIDALLALHPWQSALATRREAMPNAAYLQTLPALRTTVAGATAGTEERAAAVVDGYLYRHLKRVRATFDGDVLLPLIIGEIAHRNVAMLGHPRESAQWVERLGSRFRSDASDGRHGYLPTNTYSMSQSMGVPDTTLRREVAHLRMRKWVSVDAAGNLAVEAEAVRRHSELCDLEALNDMAAGYRRLVAMGMSA
jgi:hypothetical protein